MIDETIDRRRFLTVLGVTGAGTAALSGCSTGKVEKLIPYLVQSEDQVPGIPTWYASTCTECSAGCGIHVKTREARAIKLEGNPAHPVNGGSLCHRGQAALQGLYNPGRTKAPMLLEGGARKEITWDDAITRLADKLKAAPGKVAVLSGAGPGTFGDLLAAWTGALGGRVVRYEPFDRAPERVANRQVFGLDELPVYDFAAAKYIVSFGADFLETWGNVVEQQRGFAQSHGFEGAEMAKHVYAGPRMNLTGMNADEWHALAPGSEAALALAMANIILSERTTAPQDANGLRDMLAAHTAERAAQATGLTVDGIRKLAREFASASPSLAVAGGVGAQHKGAVEVAAAVNLLNYVAGNVGRTVRFGAGLPMTDGYAGVEQLIAAMDAGEIAVLIVHEANPVHAVPKSAKFAEAMAKVPFTVSTSLFLDDTAAACDLLLPNHHALERWDDLRPRAGVRGLMQPVMTPVFGTMHTGDLLLKAAAKVGGALAQFNAPSFERHLQDRWAEVARSRGAQDGGAFWREALQRGGLYDDAPGAPPVRLAAGAGQAGFTAPVFEGTGDYVFLPIPTSMVTDGRGTNRPWLLENPDPVTKITWGPWIEVNPETAKHLDVRDGEVIKLTSPHGTVSAPVYVYPGVRTDVLAMPLGYGHAEFGQYAKGLGANALDLVGPGAGSGFLPYVGSKVSVEKTREFRQLARTDGNPRQLGRHIAEAMPVAHAKQGMSVEESLRNLGQPHHDVNTEREKEAIEGWREKQVEATKLGDNARELPRWGMAIDLAKCTGCSACVTACYSENNIPWVGYDNVVRGREMTWLRIERYFEGGTEPGEPFGARPIPMLCQHCENAPCEPVCPVYASYHTPDGLNGQVYNRCVGTRYCGNNCPYKVRYFNWFPFAKRAFESPLDLQLNPDVTVRARGVMEKCTFCVQRIRGAQHQARLEDRPLKDGDVVTACQQACPSGAIVFGNVADPASRVAKAKEDHREYHVLEELNVRPSVTYLAKVLA
ncbi:MAG: molybdopterin-dependent oxidoreductase [Gemmatimonadales bacterium]|nr:molybdopterin-dependent oxidoreductase [Gemmatimonadales bacterium]